MFTATGTLKGYDQLLNLVLDGTIEHMQGMYNMQAHGGYTMCACIVPSHMYIHTHTHTHTLRS